MVRCRNSNRGWFNQECGQPATWIGSQPSQLYPGKLYEQPFCDRCREQGDEAASVTAWRRTDAV